MPDLAGNGVIGFLKDNSDLKYKTGIAKLRFCPLLNVANETPITLPSVSSIGPPLLPGDIGAVICKMMLLSTLRKLLTIPFENVPSRPCGLPIA